jgi:hypothetical protein
MDNSKLLSFSEGEEELKDMIPKKRALAKSSNSFDNENDGSPIRKKSKKSSEALDKPVPFSNVSLDIQI